MANILLLHHLYMPVFFTVILQLVSRKNAIRICENLFKTLQTEKYHVAYWRLKMIQMRKCVSQSVEWRFHLGSQKIVSMLTFSRQSKTIMELAYCYFQIFLALRIPSQETLHIVLLAMATSMLLNSMLPSTYNNLRSTYLFRFSQSLPGVNCRDQFALFIY